MILRTTQLSTLLDSRALWLGEPEDTHTIGSEVALDQPTVYLHLTGFKPHFCSVGDTCVDIGHIHATGGDTGQGVAHAMYK